MYAGQLTRIVCAAADLGNYSGIGENHSYDRDYAMYHPFAYM